MLETLDLVVRGRLGARSIQMTRNRVIQRVVDQRRLARSGHAGDADEQSNRKIEIDALQVVPGCADDLEQALPVRLVAHQRRRYRLRTRQVLSGQRLRRCQHFGRGTLRDDLASMLASTRAHVNDPIRGEDCFLVMLDDKHAVAQVAQMLERLEQPAVVALMEPDRRLVEHVHHAGQPAADLRRESNPLRLAAGQRVRRPIERQVVEPDVVQELQARDDFLDDLVGNLRALSREDQRRKEGVRFLQRQVRHLEDRPLAIRGSDPYVARLALQSRTRAFRTRLVVQVLRELLAHHHRIGLPIASLEIRNDPFERMLAHRSSAALVDVRERDLLSAAAVQNRLLNIFGQLLERLVEIEPIVLRQALQHREVELVSTVPALDRAAAETHVWKRDDALRIEILDDTEPVTLGTRTHRIVEREEPWLELLQRVIADGAGELRREEIFAAGRRVLIWIRRQLDGDRAAVTFTQCRLVRLGETLLEFGADLQSIDDDVDRVLRRLRELRRVVDLVDLAVDAQADKTFRAQLDEELDMLTLPIDDDRRQDHQPRAFRERERRVNHLRDRLRLEFDLRMIRAVRIADAREEETQVVVDLGDRPDRRSRVVAGGLLLDRDRRRQAFDQVDVRLFHQLQELARICGQRLDIAALAFGIQRIERKRRLPRSRQSRDDDELVPGDVEADVLEIMRTRAAYSDVFHALIEEMRDRRWCRRPRG